MAIGDPPNEDFDLDAARRELIGKVSPRVRARYPVEYDPIRRYCKMVDDTNPLFLNIEHAADSTWGAVIAPPTMVDMFAGGGPPASATRAPSVPTTRGNHFMMLGVTWEYLKPVKVGDWLSSEGETVDIYEKPLKLDPKALWTISERRVYNQHDELVAVGTSTLLSHRTAEEIAADPHSRQQEQAS